MEDPDHGRFPTTTPDTHRLLAYVADLELEVAGVLAALGYPPDLYDVTVRPLWENHYRVNVLVGPDPTAVRIAHSYFVEAREDGTIVSADPRITRSYP